MLLKIACQAVSACWQAAAAGGGSEVPRLAAGIGALRRNSSPAAGSSPCHVSKQSRAACMHTCAMQRPGAHLALRGVG